MAISLKSLVSPTKRPILATIVGDGGMGKTTLASMFPRPVFIRTEDGTTSLNGRDDVALFPDVVRSSADLFEQIEALATEQHKFSTLVIDSITQLSAIIEGEVVRSDPKGSKSINQAHGGYGAGYNMAADLHRKVREACGYLSETRGMHIVFIAHADKESVDLPDQPSFMRYSIRMNSRFIAPYTDNVDLVAFIKLQMYAKDEKAISTGERIITCYPTASHISKNRFGITQDLVFSLDSFPFQSIL